MNSFLTQLLVIVALTLGGATCVNRPTCTTAGKVHEGEEATVQCQFHTDVKGRWFVVKRKPLNATKDTGTEKVVKCYWIEKRVCKPIDGYSIRGNEGSVQNITIKHVSKLHEGLYGCQLLDNLDFDYCPLIISPPVSLETEDTQTEKVNLPGDSDYKERPDHPLDDSFPTGAVIGVVLGVAVPLVVLVTVLWVRRRREKIPKSLHDEDRCLGNGNAVTKNVDCKTGACMPEATSLTGEEPA